MKDLLNFIVTSLVTKPEAVSIDEQREDSFLTLNLTVDPTDMGLIIGKNGQTIRAIRKLLTVRAIAENIKVNVQLTEPAGTSMPASDENITANPEPIEEPAS
ncbi:MAG: KH domain-containing protein [Candidatus Daviesbacteria bacterium]|nr:KH domain-containing protein [Candidatus Daviesbacteria bacterium]